MRLPSLTGELECLIKCADVSSLLALAHAAVTYGLVRPKMTEEPVLRVTAGRHLLQELCVDTYIPNDTHIAGGQHDLCPMVSTDNTTTARLGLTLQMIVTGANGSGKSAYGKQVALMAFMAQIGSFVPAQTAEVGVVDKSEHKARRSRLKQP
jgi:DNA mismatch repair protein MSH5